MSSKYRALPVLVDAVQWRGMNHEEVRAFLAEDYIGLSSKHNPKGSSRIIFRTPDGPAHAVIGEWIVRNAYGVHSRCKPDAFAATYESCDDAKRAEVDHFDQIREQVRG